MFRILILTMILGMPLYSQVELKGDIPTGSCTSNTYIVTGENEIKCTPINRLELFEAQRDFYYKKSELFRVMMENNTLKEEATQAGKQMQILQDNARAICRSRGQGFNVETLFCEGTLPRKIEE